MRGCTVHGASMGAGEPSTPCAPTTTRGQSARSTVSQRSPALAVPRPADGPDRRLHGAGADLAHRGKLEAVATVASYGLAVIGFVMMAAAGARTFGSSLKYVYTRPLLINALRTNGNHAELLCKSEPTTYFGAIGASIK